MIKTLDFLGGQTIDGHQYRETLVQDILHFRKCCGYNITLSSYCKFNEKSMDVLEKLHTLYYTLMIRSLKNNPNTVDEYDV